MGTRISNYAKLAILVILKCLKEIQLAKYIYEDFSHKDRKYSISPSLIRSLLLPPLCEKHSFFRNRAHQHRIMLHVRGVFLVVLPNHLSLAVIKSVRIYPATIHAYSASVNAILRTFFKKRLLNVKLLGSK